MAPSTGDVLTWGNKEKNGTLELSNHKTWVKRLIAALQNELSPSPSEITEYTPSCLGNQPGTGLNSSVHFELGTVL